MYTAMSQHLKKFGLLTSLYIAQGLPFGFFTQALPALLREKGIGLETIGLGALLALPWAAKWLWAPWLDKGQNHRQWIIVANVIAVFACLLLSRFDLAELANEKLWLLYFAFFLLNLTAASQDIATDAIAVMQLTEAERGIGNGIQVAGYRVGMILSGGALLAWFSLLGWERSVQILAALLALSTLPILFFNFTSQTLAQNKEPINKELNTKEYSVKNALWLFNNKSSRLWLFTLSFYKFGDSIASPMLRPMLIDRGLTIEDIAYLVGTIGFTAGLLGALLGGAVINLIGHRLALRLFLAINALAILAYAWVAAGQFSRPSLSPLSLKFACAFEHFAGGMATVALFTEMMYHCRPHHEATDYTFQACLVVLVGILGSVLSGFIAQGYGYSLFFTFCAALTLAALPMVIWYQTRADLIVSSCKV